MFGKNVTAATDAPRIHHQLVPNVLEVESGITSVSRPASFGLSCYPYGTLTLWRISLQV